MKLSDCSNDRTKHSANPFDAGWYGALLTWQIPFCCVNTLKALAVNWEPLSVTICSGIPWVLSHSLRTSSVPNSFLASWASKNNQRLLSTMKFDPCSIFTFIIVCCVVSLHHYVVCCVLRMCRCRIGYCLKLKSSIVRRKSAHYVEFVDHFFATNETTNASRKKSAFLVVIGLTTYTVVRNLVSPTKPGKKSYDELVKALKDYFNPTPWETVQYWRFHNRFRNLRHWAVFLGWILQFRMTYYVTGWSVVSTIARFNRNCWQTHFNHRNSLRHGECSKECQRDSG